MTTKRSTTFASHYNDEAQIVEAAVARRPVETFDIFLSMTRPEAQALRKRIYKYLDRLKMSGVEDHIDKQALFRAMYAMRIVPLDSVPGMFTLRFKVDSAWWNGQVIAAIMTKKRLKELREKLN